MLPGIEGSVNQVKAWLFIFETLIFHLLSQKDIAFLQNIQ